MKVLYLYAMHRYDLVFFYRLLNSTSRQKSRHEFDVVLIVTEKVYQIPHVKRFLSELGETLLIAPVLTPSNVHFGERLMSLMRLRRWHRNNVNHKAPVVMLDKSMPESRFFLKRHRKALLVRQVESTDKYTLDLLATGKDMFLSLVLGGYTARHMSGVEKGDPKAVVFRGHQHIKIAYQTVVEKSDGDIALPTIFSQAKNRILIFGSRFLEWPYFQGKSFSSRLNIVSNIYQTLATQYSDHEFIYLPHPREGGTEYELIQKIVKTEMLVPKNYFSAEHFLLENRDIAHTISLGSTASLSAYLMGFSVKVFFPLLAFDASVAAAYANIFEPADTSIFAQTIDDVCNKSHQYVNTSASLCFQRFLDLEEDYAGVN